MFFFGVKWAYIRYTNTVGKQGGWMAGLGFNLRFRISPLFPSPLHFDFFFLGNNTAR